MVWTTPNQNARVFLLFQPSVYQTELGEVLNLEKGTVYVSSGDNWQSLHHFTVWKLFRSMVRFNLFSYNNNTFILKSKYPIQFSGHI